jgi:hypothetical protein
MKMTMKMIDKKIVALVVARAQGYCEACGRPEQATMALHHRKLKSRGGKDSASNLIRVHHSCHNMSTGSIHANPSWAEDRGLMVPSWKETTEYPLIGPDGSIVLLQNDGTIITLEKGKENGHNNQGQLGDGS